MSKVSSIENLDHFERVIDSKHYAVIYVGASWCPYCKKLLPIFENLPSSDNFKNDVTFYCLDRDSREDINVQLKIGSIPTILIFQHGREIARGQPSADKLQDWVVQQTIRPRNDSSRNVLMDEPTANFCTLNPTVDPIKGRGILGLLRPARRATKDPEPGCLFAPAEDSLCMQLAEAREGNNRLTVTFCKGSSPSTGESKSQVIVKLSFLSDPTVEARFTAADFNITFGPTNVEQHPNDLRITEISPTILQGPGTEARYTYEEETVLPSHPAGVGMGDAGVDQVRQTLGVKFTEKTTESVLGECTAGSRSAKWTFEEDSGPGGRHGLKSDYELSIRLSAAHIIPTRFWARATVAFGDGKPRTPSNTKELKLGSRQHPFEKVLDLQPLPSEDSQPFETQVQE